MILTVLFCIIWLVNLILVFTKTNSKVVFFITLVVMETIFFCNTTSGDYENYLIMYNKRAYFDALESGFAWLMNLASNLSLSFNAFQCVICTISLLITLFVFKQFSNNYHFFFSIYFIYQFFYDIDTLRNFFARSLLLLCCFWVFKGERKYFYPLIFCAFLVHHTMIFYLPLFFLMQHKSISMSSLKFCSVIVFLLCIVFLSLGEKFDFMSSFISLDYQEISLKEKMSAYSTKSTRFGSLIYI